MAQPDHKQPVKQLMAQPDHKLPLPMNNHKYQQADI